jgi:hypothetical protein
LEELTFKEKGAEKDFLLQRRKSTIAKKKFDGLYRRLEEKESSHL